MDGIERRLERLAAGADAAIADIHADRREIRRRPRAARRMSDDIDIRAGGIVAVDTETLRAVATRLEALAENVEGTAEAFRRATRCAVEVAGTSNDIHVLGVGADAAATECRDLATALRSSADIYEVVELTASQSAAAAAGDEAAAARHEAAIDAIGRRNPDARPAGPARHLLEGPRPGHRRSRCRRPA